MTHHHPPMPEAATSPYPLHPEPIPEAQKQATAAAEAEAQAQAEAAERRAALTTTAIQVGAAIGVGAAAVTGILYARRRTAKPRAASTTKRSSDDKTKRGKADRSRVAAGEPYEVAYFARKHGISAAEARAIIKQAGPSRAAANELAKRRKA